TLAINDEYGPAADFLGTARVDRDPAHVTFVANPKMDFANRGLVGDHAYWLSGVRLRDAGGDNPLGTIDVRSEGFGATDPTPASSVRSGQTVGTASRACRATAGFARAAVTPAGRGLRFLATPVAGRRFDVSVFRESVARRVVNRLVARFRARRGSFSWAARGR